MASNTWVTGVIIPINGVIPPGKDRWRSPLPCNVLVYHSPLRKSPPFGNCAIYFHYGVNTRQKVFKTSLASTTMVSYSISIMRGTVTHGVSPKKQPVPYSSPEVLIDGSYLFLMMHFFPPQVCLEFDQNVMSPTW